MLLPLLLMAADAKLVPAQTTPAARAATAPRQTLMDAVAARMSATGRPIFQRFLQQTLTPQVTADAREEAQYRVALHQQVAQPTLDVDAVSRLITQRKVSEAQHLAAIRQSALAMIKSLPAADRKLALTAIFADARLPTPPAAAKPAAAPKK